MTTETKTMLKRCLQHPRLVILFLATTTLFLLILDPLFPTLKAVGLAEPAMTKRGAQALVVLGTGTIFYLIRVLLGSRSEIACPFCASYKFFVIQTKATGDNIPKGYSLRRYKCNQCQQEEKLFIAPLQLPVDTSTT